MMKKIFIICIVLVGCVGILSAQKPEKIYSIAKVSKPHEYYIMQAELWWKEIEKDKTNEDAWCNYYKANRYCCFTYKGYGFDGHRNDGWEKESQYLKRLEVIVQLVDSTIPNSYTALRLKTYGYPGDNDRFKSLEKAYLMRPYEPDLYDAIITYYEMKGDLTKRKEFCEKLYNANYISSGLLNYSYNLLMTLKPNSIILTFMDNDTYPLWLLQDVKNIRTDVTVLNVSLLADPDYQTSMYTKLGIKSNAKIYENGSTTESEKEIIEYILKNNKLEQHPLYIGLPARNQMKGYEYNLYLVGLALEYSNNNIDNIALLINNFENKYALDYISNRFENDMSAEVVDRININYMPAIFKLYEHYTLSGDLSRAKKVKDLGLIISGKCGQDWLNKVSELLR